MQSNNVSIDQAESMAMSKGMSATEFAKLKKRLALPEAPKAKVDKKTTKKKTKDADSEDEEDEVKIPNENKKKLKTRK